MAEPQYPAIYRSKHGSIEAGRCDVFVHEESAGMDAKGRILLELLHKDPLSAAPGRMWIDPVKPGTIVREESNKGVLKAPKRRAKAEGCNIRSLR